MADKKLIYNIGGTSAEALNSGSTPTVYYNDTNNSLVINGLTINKLTSSIGNNGFLSTDVSGNLSAISTSSLQTNSYLRSNGTNWIFATASGQLSGNFAVGSDISGTFGNGIVTNITNVTSGILPISRGGTGISSFLSGGIVFNDLSSQLKFVKPDSNGAVLRPSGSGWYSGGASGSSSGPVNAAYFTCSSPGVSTSYTWTKPAGYSNVRVVLMAGGGGGGGASPGPAATSCGGGGGAGGLSMYEFTIDAALTPTYAILVGGGGAGGLNVGGLVDPPNRGGDGGNSFFINPDFFIGLDGNTTYPSPQFYAYGGSGGAQGFRTGIGGGYGQGPGWGNLSRQLGGSGSVRNTTIYQPSGIASGGGAAGSYNSVVPVAADGGDFLILNATVAARGVSGITNLPTASPGTPGGVTTISLGIYPDYPIYIGGGGGGGGSRGGLSPTSATSGAPGIYGSGGGGAGKTGPNYDAALNIGGGRGGDGYVLVVYW